MRFSKLKFLIALFFLQCLLIPQTKKLTIDDIYYNPELKSVSIKGLKWFDNGNKFSFITIDEEGYAIYQHDVKTGVEDRIIGGSELKTPDNKMITLNNYEWSSDGRYILITGLLPARSVKTGGTFYVYDLTKRKFCLIVDSEEEQVNIQFSPDSKKLGFVRANNIYVVDIESGNEKQMTFDGSETILNGVFDWVYEEELSIICGWEWSPDSKSIAFWRLDQSEVPVVYITKYDSLYFPPIKQYYPKAGAKNSTVRIGIVDITSAKTVWVNIGEETDIYIPRIKFTKDPARLSLQKLNRLQNKLELIIADVKTGNTKTILTETDSCWVDVYDGLKFFDDEKHFIWSSERSGFLHLYLYDLEGNLISQITKGDWEIGEIISVNENTGIVYYTSLERSPLCRDLYSINLNGTNKRRLTEQAGTHSVEMSTNNSYFIDKYSNVNTVPSTILYDIEGNEIQKLIEPNMSGFEDYDLPQVEFLTFTTSEGIELSAAMIKPPDFDPSRKYPALLYNYSGPGSQKVKDEWESSLTNRMFAQNGYIVFWLDNRGTGGRGKSFENIVYKNLGHYEVMDMIEGAKYLISTGYVYPNRIGIYGSSYGGYIAALTILRGADYFTTAIAGAPVIHWRFYDTIYTERYMQTPELNPEGYRISSPLNYADKLKGKLLLVHGTADDNVHLQNTIVFIDALQKADKQFEVMLYPEISHKSYGKHYLELMSEFIYKNL